jgi:hypothetical protein
MMHVLRMLGLILLLAGTLFTAGCATTTGTTAPSTDIPSLKSFYVVKQSTDSNNINQLIAQQLSSMGLTATTGPVTSTPQGVDAVLTYQDFWKWDIAMRLVRLHVQIRDPATNNVLSSAQISRLSTLDLSPSETLVKEVLDSAFNSKITPEDRALLNSFYSGKASLDRGGIFSNVPRIKTHRELHDREEWSSLAYSVLMNGLDGNINWYYLGRAAEGMGYDAAALTYYQKSVQLSQSDGSSGKCLGTQCSNFIFPGASINRIEMIKKAMGKPGAETSPRRAQ